MERQSDGEKQENPGGFVSDKYSNYLLLAAQAMLCKKMSCLAANKILRHKLCQFGKDICTVLPITMLP